MIKIKSHRESTSGDAIAARSFFGISSKIRLLAPAKALPPTVLTLFGITVFSRMHPEKTPLPILVIVAGRTAFVRLLHSEKL